MGRNGEEACRRDVALGMGKAETGRVPVPLFLLLGLGMGRAPFMEVKAFCISLLLRLCWLGYCSWTSVFILLPSKNPILNFTTSTYCNVVVQPAIFLKM